MWYAGHNDAGYLPDNMDDEGFETFDEAKRSLISDMLLYANQVGEAGDEALAEELTHAAEDVNLWSESTFDQSILVDQVYWISESEE